MTPQMITIDEPVPELTAARMTSELQDRIVANAAELRQALADGAASIARLANAIKVLEARIRRRRPRMPRNRDEMGNPIPHG